MSRSVPVVLGLAAAPLLLTLAPAAELLFYVATSTGPCWIAESEDKFLLPSEAALIISTIATPIWIVLSGLVFLALRRRYRWSFRLLWAGGAIALMCLGVLWASEVWLSDGAGWMGNAYLGLYRANCSG